MGFTNLKLGQVNPFALKNDFGNMQTNPLSQGKQTINFSDGVYQPSGDVEDISSELGALMGELGISEENGVQETNETPAIDSDKEIEETKQKAIQDKIKELQDEYDKNLEKMEKLKVMIEELMDKVTETVIKAAAEKEKAIKENEKLYQKLVDDELKAYIEANKEGGKGMTHEELLKNIDDALSHVPNIASAIRTALEASHQLSELTSCAGFLNGFVMKNENIKIEINENNRLLNTNGSNNSILDEINDSLEQTNDTIDSLQGNTNANVDDSLISNLKSSNSPEKTAKNQGSKDIEFGEYRNIAGAAFNLANHLRDEIDEILNDLGYEKSKITTQYTNRLGAFESMGILEENGIIREKEEEQKEEEDKKKKN